MFLLFNVYFNTLEELCYIGNVSFWAGTSSPFVDSKFIIESHKNKWVNKIYTYILSPSNSNEENNFKPLRDDFPMCRQFLHVAIRYLKGINEGILVVEEKLCPAF